MSIQLSPEQERIVSQAIEAGVIKDADDVVAIGVEAVRQKLKPAAGPASKAQQDNWATRLHDWIQSHPTDTPLLSDEAISRESIYGNRGE